jgi:Flp pilus assembly protein TadG
MLKRFRRTGRPRDEGAAAVEFALVMPLLVLLIFGIIEFGGAYNAYITVTHAAREGARMAAVGQFDAAAVKARAYPLDAAKVTVTGPTLVTDPSGDYYQVKITYPYQLTIPLWDSQSLTLTSTARMRKEE